jgi:hypothetical protein
MIPENLRKTPENLWKTPENSGTPWNTPVYLSGLQVSYKDFVSRFRIPSKNESRYKLDQPKQSWSYFSIFTDIAILGATMGLSNFPVQIQNLLKKQVQIQVEPSQMELVIFPDFCRSNHIRCHNGNV